MAGPREVEYLVLPDLTNPVLLARVRWPDVFQAMSPARPYWQDDPGLFDLPYDPSSTTLTRDQAAAVAADWGVRLADDTAEPSARSLIRRMPADWSNLSKAETRAWSLEFAKPARNRLLRRRRRVPAFETNADVIDLTEARDHVIDLTDAGSDGLATAEDA